MELSKIPSLVIEAPRKIMAAIGAATLNLLEAMESAQDCWPEDTPFEQSIKSGIWDQPPPEV